MLPILSLLTIVFVLVQLILFAVHYQVSNLIDSLVNASIALSLLHPVILWPIAMFIGIQVFAYGLFIAWLWFITMSVSEFFKLQKLIASAGIFLWMLASFTLLMLNRHYFPHSFFAKYMVSFGKWQNLVLAGCLTFLLIMTLIAYVNFFKRKQFRVTGSVLLFVIVTVFFVNLYDKKSLQLPYVANDNPSRPNIIFIGIDSLRPDFIHFYGNKNIHTSHLDHFLETSTHFTESYTPLARTFPAWMSILTARYPRHHEARNNLVNPAMVSAQETLAKRLQEAGYETIYATDEKRFSNITRAHGFDRLPGPAMGVNDFLLGGLTDFPMTNLLVNMPIGRWLFPYHYGNRAAAITYYPESFLQLIKAGLLQRSGKPVFLSVHLCLSHWPYSWADGEWRHLGYAAQYAHSVQGVDQQFGRLMRLLKKSGMLENSLVVLLSDHGTALGLPHDRIITEKQYQGDKKSLALIQKFKLSNKKVYTIDTAYGQGTQSLSLSQYHVLLAFHYPRLPQGARHQFSSLMDIAPTILDLLHLPPLKHADGISLLQKSATARSFFMETGDSISEIETDQIYVEKVLKHEIGIYRIDPVNGLLSLDEEAERGLIKNKQLAIMQGDWLLAHFPARLDKQPAHKNQPATSKILPAYFVLANRKTGEWTIGLDSPFAKKAPVEALLRQLQLFYGDELPTP